MNNQPRLIIGVGCDEGQYLLEMLPEKRENWPLFTAVVKVGPMAAARFWNQQYTLNNIKSARRHDDRNWHAELCRPVEWVPPMPSQETIDALAERDEMAADAARGVL